MRGFRRRQTITELGKKWGGSEKRSPFRNIAPQRKPPDITILDTFATSHRSFKNKCHDHAFLFPRPCRGAARSSLNLRKSIHCEPWAVPCPLPPPKSVLLCEKDPKFCSLPQLFEDFGLKGFFLKDSSKKYASPLPFCRGGLGEAPYNTPRHSLQRCRSKAL